VGDDLERYKLCEGHFRDWLHSGLTGCRFASTFATEKPVRIDFYSPLGPIDHEQIAAFIDGTASREITAVLLFPALRTARDTVNVLSVLTRGARWRLTRARWPKGYRKPDSIALGLEWRTKTGEVSDAMGLAYHGTMPVTRRAPYLAIVVWGGSHLNPYLKAGARVGVASAPTGLDKSAHRKLMQVSDARVRALLAVPPAEDAAWLRRVAFILPKASATKLLKQGS
jgi:hypothetical protein